ncbi:hypothetical protein HGRIS_014710 [Hohenbuehelia grisea]|uniref:Signal recognition particle subunit SRP68 n=1 Tax=Hohenbuehelia grisea TaxID=104357 RepID=A0ABR3IQH6_9AGAR
MSDVVAFRALHITNEQRTAHGLRYNDFERYRKHCANRTHRLRSTLKMTHGKGREFKSLPVVTTDKLRAEHLELLLLEAERAWSYSQELFAAANKPSREQEEKIQALKRNAKGRFRRAVHWATQLLSHCQNLHSSNRLSAENLLQANIYILILNGRWLRHRYVFEDALSQLSVAKGLLDELASTAPTSREQALAVLFSDEISPEIRYCAHELGRSKAYDVEGIVAELSPKHRNELVEGCDSLVAKVRQSSTHAGKGPGSQKLKEIAWDGEPVPVRNPELVDVLLKVQDAEGKIASQDASSTEASPRTKSPGSKKGVAAYDAILAALSDAEEVARKLSEAQQTTGSSAGAQAGARDIHFVYAYIVYQLLSRRIQRDLLLMSALLGQQSSQPSTKTSTKSRGDIPKPAKAVVNQVDSRLYPALVKLLDTILQSLGQMRTLSIVDDSPDLASAVEVRLSYAKARRCLYVARCYAPTKKYAEALTLLQHANLHLREARSTASISDIDAITVGTPSFYPLHSDDYQRLETDVTATSLQFKKDWFAYNGGSATASSAGYKKPLFFNIALNYAQLDMDRLQERAGVAAAPPPPIVAPAPEKSRPGEPAFGQKKPPTSTIEEARPATPEPTQAAGRGGLSSLLGGWWGRS